MFPQLATDHARAWMRARDRSFSRLAKTIPGIEKKYSLKRLGRQTRRSGQCRDAEGQIPGRERDR